MSRSKPIAEDHTGWRHMAAASVGPTSHRAPMALPRNGGHAVKRYAVPVVATHVRLDRGMSHAFAS
jgi:hypothetical protein